MDINYRPGGIIVTEHAWDRWTERICSQQRGYAPWDLPDVFREAISVGIPEPERGRLHPPSGALIVFTNDWWEGPDVLVTVLHADPIPLRDDHLKTCSECGQRYDPQRGGCPWEHGPTQPSARFEAADPKIYTT